MKTSKRTRLAASLAAALAAVGFSSQASAIPLTYLEGPMKGQSFQGGAIMVKAINFDTGALYTGLPVDSALGYGDGGASPDRAAGEAALNAQQSRAPLGPPQTDEDGWGIFKITEIYSVSNDGVTGARIYSDLLSSYEITAMFYGTRDFYLNQESAGSGSAFAGQIIDGYNMHVDFYMDPSKNFDQTGGPGARVGVDGYPTVTDGTKVLSLVSTPGFINADGTNGGEATEFESNTAKTGYAAFDVVDGDAETYAQFNTDGIGFGGSFGSSFIPGLVKSATDVWFQFTSSQGGNGWDITSNDPMRANISRASVPETGSTLALFACALPMLAMVRRRRGA